MLTAITFAEYAAQMKQRILLNAPDQHPICAYHFLPSRPAKGTVVVACAMGTPQSYYQGFAQWLALQGFDAFTFDFRAIGESKHAELTDYRHSIIDWATLDASTMLDYVLEQRQLGPVYWIGHSLGGQIHPLVTRISEVNKIITFACGTGYWKKNAPPIRRKIWWFWNLLVPISQKIYVYYPGSKFGMVGDLPSSIMSQWRLWCSHPDYCVGVEDEHVARKFEASKVPLTSIGFYDDEMLSEQNLQDLFELFGSDEKQLKMVNPKELGLSRIGHMGFFRASLGESLWSQILLPELLNHG